MCVATHSTGCIAYIPDNDFTEFAIVFLCSSHVLTNLRTETEIRDILVLTVDTTESRHFLGPAKLLK